MILIGDCQLNGDDKLKCLLSLSSDQVIEPDDLNQFKENESICSVSREDLEKRLMKSFSINIWDWINVTKEAFANECVRYCHYAIDLANTNENWKVGKNAQAMGQAPLIQKNTNISR